MSPEVTVSHRMGSQLQTGRRKLRADRTRGLPQSPRAGTPCSSRRSPNPSTAGPHGAVHLPPRPHLKLLEIRGRKGSGPESLGRDGRGPTVGTRGTAPTGVPEPGSSSPLPSSSWGPSDAPPARVPARGLLPTTRSCCPRDGATARSPQHPWARSHCLRAQSP